MRKYLAFFVALTLSFNAFAAWEDGTLVIGKVSSNPRKHYKYLEPISRYAFINLQSHGIKKSRVIFAEDNQKMLKLLREGKVDWITETPVSASLFHNEGGAEYFLSRRKKTQYDYYSMFFARKDSGITNLDQLNGKTIALEDPGSSSAYYIPTAILLNKGYQLNYLLTPRDKAPQDKVGYVFSRAEVNSAKWVFNKTVDLGVVNNHDWYKKDKYGKNDHVPDSYKKEFVVIHKTQNFPRNIELIRKGMPEKLKQALKKVLLEAHLNEEGAQALRKYQKSTRFDKINPRVIKELDAMYEDLKLVEDASIK